MSTFACIAAVEPTTLEELKRDQTVLESFLLADRDSTDAAYLEMPGAWYDVHLALEATVEQATARPNAHDALLGGTPIGKDNGYGPPRCFAPVEVQAIASALATVLPTATAAPLTPTPDQDTSGNALQNSRQMYSALKEMYVTAARRGHGMVLWIC